jgi:hypothetical protein
MGGDFMIWPVPKPGALYAAAKLLRIAPDEAGGELLIRAVFDGREKRDIIYEGVFYSQLDESSAGLTVTLVNEITYTQLKQPRYRQAEARLYDDCGADDAFLRDMCRRGSHLYVHHTEDGGEYIVLAKRMKFG